MLYSQIMSGSRLLASTELWTARMELPPRATPGMVHSVMTRFVTATRISVVGYVTPSPNTLTLLRWPDTRPDYREPGIPECELALDAMAGLLNGSNVRRGIVPANTLHCVMGTGRDGYSATESVPLTDFERPDIVGYHVEPATALTVYAAGARTEPYTEQVGVLTMPTSPANEQAIHDIAVAGEQWHFTIEHGPTAALPDGRADAWETQWARAAQQGG
jgi:hypothetical protein